MSPMLFLISLQFILIYSSNKYAKQKNAIEKATDGKLNTFREESQIAQEEGMEIHLKFSPIRTAFRENRHKRGDIEAVSSVPASFDECTAASIPKKMCTGYEKVVVEEKSPVCFTTDILENQAQSEKYFQQSMYNNEEY